MHPASKAKPFAGDGRCQDCPLTLDAGVFPAGLTKVHWLHLLVATCFMVTVRDPDWEPQADMPQRFA